MAACSLRFLFLGFLILLLFKPGLSWESEDEDLELEDEEEDNMKDLDTRIKENYIILWKSLPPELYDVGENFEDFSCKTNKDCEQYFPNLDTAFEPGMSTDLPSRPYCTNNKTITNSSSIPVGRCTCGEGRCYSYSRDYYDHGMPFYYCGPCGYVGAQCYNSTCTHRLAECVGDFCECRNDGIFYNMAYCYMPYFGKTMLIQMFVSTLIIVLLCGVLAYSYNRLSNSRRQTYGTRSWRRTNSVTESPVDDTPPTYDDVVEKVPTYQDAMQMVEDPSITKGLANLAFEVDCLPPPYEEGTYGIRAQDISDGTDGYLNEKPPTTEQTVKLPAAESSSTGKSNPSTTPRQPIEQPLKKALGELKTVAVDPVND